MRRKWLIESEVKRNNGGEVTQIFPSISRERAFLTGVLHSLLVCLCVCVHYRCSDQAKKHITFVSAKVNCHSDKHAALCMKLGDRLQYT